VPPKTSTGYYVPTATATSFNGVTKFFHWLLRANGHCNQEKYRLLMSNSDIREIVFLETHDLLEISLEFRILARCFQSKALTNSSMPGQQSLLATHALGK